MGDKTKYRLRVFVRGERVAAEDLRGLTAEQLIKETVEALNCDAVEGVGTEVNGDSTPNTDTAEDGS
jgi:hypothetical protein